MAAINHARCGSPDASRASNRKRSRLRSCPRRCDGGSARRWKLVTGIQPIPFGNRHRRVEFFGRLECQSDRVSCGHFRAVPTARTYSFIRRVACRIRVCASTGEHRGAPRRLLLPRRRCVTFFHGTYLPEGNNSGYAGNSPRDVSARRAER